MCPEAVTKLKWLASLYARAFLRTKRYTLSVGTRQAPEDSAPVYGR
jgi:hypothetical protein